VRQAAHLVWLALGACPGLHTLHVTPSELYCPAGHTSQALASRFATARLPFGHMRHWAPCALNVPTQGVHPV